jgi:hypothetical protein
VLFIGVVVTAARTALRRARRTDHVLDAAAASALTGVALTGLFLGSFAVITSAMPLMVVVGLATAPTEGRGGDADDLVPLTSRRRG